MNRRRFLEFAAAAGAASALRPQLSIATTQPEPAGFFSLGRRDSRHWLVAPDGRPFFSRGLNHIDSAPLRYAASLDIWRDKYGNSIERWLSESVSPDLKAWGFNSVGWTQEVVVRTETLHRHSPSFTFEEYQCLDLPYCHLLPFAEIHQWESETRYPDFAGQGFEEWCDYVARSQCARLADDPRLIGYFYSDCPTWTHTRPGNQWKGPLFDPDKLQTESGRDELRRFAARYYQVTHDAVRRYDKHHLIFGDRYEVRAPLADEVLEAAAPYVDVLSFQHFGKPVEVAEDLHRFSVKAGKPVLLADHSVSDKQAEGGQRHNGAGYAEMLRLLCESDACVGYHLCGAYLRNRCRKRGLRDERERPDVEALALMTRANQEAEAWFRNRAS